MENRTIERIAIALATAFLSAILTFQIKVVIKPAEGVATALPEGGSRGSRETPAVHWPRGPQGR